MSLTSCLFSFHVWNKLVEEEMKKVQSYEKTGTDVKNTMKFAGMLTHLSHRTKILVMID